jgi:hypothetical protein
VQEEQLPAEIDQLRDELASLGADTAQAHERAGMMARSLEETRQALAAMRRQMQDEQLKMHRQE